MSRIFIIVAAVLLGGIAVWFLKPPVNPVGSTVIATPAAEVRLEPKVERSISKIKTYRSSVKQKLKLPTAVAENAHKQIIASSVVQSDLHPHRITTTINTETGESETFDQRLPLPLVAFQQRFSVSAHYGYKGGNIEQIKPVARLGAQYEVMQTKNLKWNAKADVDSDGAWFVGVGVRIDF